MLQNVGRMITIYAHCALVYWLSTSKHKIYFILPARWLTHLPVIKLYKQRKQSDASLCIHARSNWNDRTAQRITFVLIFSLSCDWVYAAVRCFAVGNEESRSLTRETLRALGLLKRKSIKWVKSAVWVLNMFDA